MKDPEGETRETTLISLINPIGPRKLLGNMVDVTYR